MSAGIVTDEGLEQIVLAWTATSRYIQFGTGSGQGITDTVLAAPAQSAVLATRSQVTTSVTGDTARLTASITADENRSITEAGVVLADGTGMEIYGDFEAIDLAAGDAIVFQIDAVITQA